VTNKISPASKGLPYILAQAAFGGDDQGGDHLLAVAAFVAAVAEAFFAGGGIFGRVIFETDAGEVVEQNFEFGSEEVLSVSRIVK
jgi:hypothetical protein